MDGDAATEHKLSIASAYESLDEVSAWVETTATEAGIAAEHALDLVVAVTEAVNNAIQHGNRLDASKQVHIKIVADPESFTVW
jgi:serine/threonine-protein kinase RsbW